MTIPSLSPRRWLATSALWLLALPIAAQAKHLGDPIEVSATARGLESIDGVLWASGPHYKASLTTSGVRFVPALGRRSPRVRDLCFELLSSGRGDGPTTHAQPVAPSADALEVRYVRDGFVETYAVLATGLEQSFVFAERPRGTGDLVVRGRVRTDLPLSRSSARGLEFTDPEHGGVAIGEVIGTDARGRQVSGALRCVADASTGNWLLELSLPGSFVDSAALPLVLDPFFAPLLSPSGGPDDSYSDVAYEPTTDVYLFVWDRSSATFNVDLVGRRFTGAGVPVGGLITLKLGVGGLSRNRVVAVDARDAFVATWYETAVQSSVWATSVQAATGAVAPPLLLATGSDPDAGVATEQDDAAIVVWSNAGVQGMRVTVAPSGALTAGPVQPLSPVGLTPMLSRSGGTTGRLLAAWGQQSQQTINGVVIDANLQMLAGGPLFANPAVPNSARLDGDGTRWIVAFWNGNGPAGNVDCRQITFDPVTSTLTAGPQIPIANQPSTPEHSACVAWLGNAVAVGHVSVTGFGTAGQTTSAVVGTIDDFTCAPCAAAATAATHPAGWFVFEPRLAARHATNGAATEAMLTWTEGSTSAFVVGRIFRSDDGLEWDRGGGCGGGVSSHGCAVPGNGGYELHLDAAPPAVPAFVLLGTQQASLACGGCTIVPDPVTSAALFVAFTSSAGSAALPLPIPASGTLSGFTFFDQWLTLGAAGSCFGLAASNALEIRVQ